MLIATLILLIIAVIIAWASFVYGKVQSEKKQEYYDRMCLYYQSYYDLKNSPKYKKGN